MKVLFLLQRPESWINIETVWSSMQARAGYSLTLWLLPYDAEDNEVNISKLADTRNLLDEIGVRYHLWNEGDAIQAGDYDVVILTNPYDAERHPSLHFARLRESVATTVYIPYGLAVGGGRKNLRLQYAQPVHLGCTVLPARSEYEREEFQRARGEDPRNVEILGHPRFDTIVHRYAQLTEEASRCLSTKKTVLWNSHFSFGRRYAYTSNFSTLDLLGPEILEFAKTHRGLMRLWWRPHPKTLAALVTEGILLYQDIPAFRSELASVGIHFDEDPDHVPAFVQSDAMLSDVGSFLVEYLIADKPMLPLLNPRGESVTQEASQLVQELGSAGDTDTVRAFLEQVVFGPSPPSPSGSCKRFLPMLDGRAGERLVDRIEILHMSKPENSGGVDRRTSLRSDTALATPQRRLRSQGGRANGSVESSPVATPVLDRLCTQLRLLRQRKESCGAMEFKLRKLAAEVRTEVVERAKSNPVMGPAVLSMRSYLSKRKRNRQQKARN